MNKDGQINWKEKFQDLLQVCQGELKKTTKIGRKMISASKTTTDLHEAFEALGQLAAKAIKNKELDWDNADAKTLVEKIEKCQKELVSIEEDVKKIKLSPGMDVSGIPKSDDSNNQDH